MNKVKWIVLFCVCLFSQLAFSEERLCVVKSRITAVDFGYTSHNGYGQDDGNAFYIKYPDYSGAETWFPLSRAHNLNDVGGPSIASMLMTAFVMGYKVSLYDSSGTLCDDFERVYIAK